jgi:regulatory protein
MEHLSEDHVTRLDPATGKPGRVRVTLASGAGPVLTEARCVELGVRVGRAWTAQLAAACARGAALDRHKDRARRMLARGPRSRAQLRARLLCADADAGEVDAALDELERGGLIDDAAYAQAVVETGTDAGPGRRYLLERKLALAGVAHDTIAQALRAASPSPESDARNLVRARLAKSKTDEPRARTAARLARVLASRGFDEYTARDAIESVMGTIGDDDDTPMD